MSDKKKLSSYHSSLVTYHCFLLLLDVLAAQIVKKLFEFVCLFLASRFNAEQYAAALQARIVNFGAMLWDACANERAYHAARSSACTCARRQLSSFGL